ncbi:MAG: hypothetical protein NZ927_04235 [Candidatus Calescibacterium sp.]|nr:hypothetical protein [Candidatus Calescibacterium sp.]
MASRLCPKARAVFLSINILALSGPPYISHIFYDTLQRVVSFPTSIPKADYSTHFDTPYYKIR